MSKINWGIVGPGHIAEKFAEALSFVSKKNSGAVLYAVASRDSVRAETFAGEYGFAKSYGSYEELFSDPEVDAVYIATPHVFHYELSVRALNCGKNVLVEKPACVNAGELKSVLELAKSKNLFYLEATWTRFNPTVTKVMQAISGGAIGAVSHVEANFAFRNKFDPNGRLFNPALAGGALLDLGIYPVTFFCMVEAAANSSCELFGSASASLSMPQQIVSSAKIDRGVDIWNSINLTSGGITSSLSSSVVYENPVNSTDAYVYGSKGYIVLRKFWMSQEAYVYEYVNERGPEVRLAETISIPFDCNGYEYEILETMKCIEEKRTQSELHTWNDTFIVTSIMDECRKQWKFFYPFEKAAEEKKSVTQKLQAMREKAVSEKAAGETVCEEDSSVTVYTDGGCLGNPGPGGWGCVILTNGDEVKLSGGEKSSTNNRMELTAAIEALKYVAENPGLRSKIINVYSDSQYVRNGITSWINNWKKNGWKTSAKKDVLNKELWLLLDKYYSQLNIRWKWVKGHAGIKYNEMCDQLCQKEMHKF